MKFKKTAVLALILLQGFTMLSGCTSESSESTGESSESTRESFKNTGEFSKNIRESSEPSDSSSTAIPANTAEEDDPKLLSLYKDIDESGYQAGMAYIGFVTSEATESEMRIYLESSQYAEQYAFLCDAPLIDAGGTELYAIVTTGTDRSASVYPAEINEDGNYDVHTDKALYEGKGRDCFLLRCNVSDLHSNVAILFKTGDESFYVYPMLSGKDGWFDNPEFYDFSIYADDSGGKENDAIIAYGLLSETDEVQYYMSLGMTLQYTGQTQIIDGRSCWIFALGTEHEGQFVREFYYGVCDNLIYFYDAVNDTWSVLGT